MWLDNVEAKFLVDNFVKDFQTYYILLRNCFFVLMCQFKGNIWDCLYRLFEVARNFHLRIVLKFLIQCSALLIFIFKLKILTNWYLFNCLFKIGSKGYFWRDFITMIRVDCKLLKATNKCFVIYVGSPLFTGNLKDFLQDCFIFLDVLLLEHS